jgi:hypothetical protein
MDAPYIDPQVLAWLEERYPDGMPEEPISEAMYNVLVGQQQVIRRVRSAIARQSHNPFKI